MAPLTWRDVAAPDVTGAAAILDRAVSNWNNGFTGIGTTMTDIRNRQRETRSAAAMPVLAGIAADGDVEGALARVTGMVNPRDMTPELQQAMLNARGLAVGYDATRAATNATNSANARTQQTHDHNVAVRDQLAAMGPGLLRMQQNAYAGDFGINNPNISEDFRQHIPGIHAGESGGDYNALFGFSNRPGGPFENVRLTDMTVADAIAFANPNGEYARYVAANNGGTVATPMGGYQVVGSTLSDAAHAMGLTGNERMTPELQDQIGQWIYENQGLGAWVGYRQGAAATVPDVASLLPANNVVDPTTLMGFVDDLYNDRRTAQTNQIEDYDAQVERDAAAAAALQTERAQQIAQEAFQNAGLNPGFDAANEILNRDDADFATLQEARQLAMGLIEGNPEYFQASGEIENSAFVDAALAQMTVNNASADGANPTMRAMEMAGASIDDSPENIEAAVSSENPAQVMGEGTYLEALGTFTSQAEAAGIVTSGSAVNAAILSVAERTGLDPRFVLGYAQQALEQGRNSLLQGALFSDESFLTEDALVEAMGDWADPSKRPALIEEQRQQALRMEEINELAERERQARTAIDVFGRRDDPQAQERVKEAQRELESVFAAVENLMDLDNKANGISVPQRSAPTSKAGDASSLIAASSEARRAAIAESNAATNQANFSPSDAQLEQEMFWQQVAQNEAQAAAVAEAEAAAAQQGERANTRVVSYEEWNQMSRLERERLGLPVSPMGYMNASEDDLRVPADALNAPQAETPPRVSAAPQRPAAPQADTNPTRATDAAQESRVLSYDEWVLMPMQERRRLGLPLTPAEFITASPSDLRVPRR